MARRKSHPMSAATKLKISMGLKAYHAKHPHHSTAVPLTLDTTSYKQRSYEAQRAKVRARNSAPKKAPRVNADKHRGIADLLERGDVRTNGSNSLAAMLRKNEERNREESRRRLKALGLERGISGRKT